MILHGNCIDLLKTLDPESIQCCVTSPPYWGLRDYGVSGQLGLESTPEEYVANMVAVFREVKRVLKKDGTLWLNLGDSYASTKEGNTNGTAGSVKQKAGVNDDKRKRTIPNGLKPKDLVGIPWRTAFALQADGWYLRSDIIWSKPNPMPESVTDRPTKAHEYIFLLSKSAKYFYDADAVKEPCTFPNEGKWGQGSEKGYINNGDFPARKLHEFVSGETRNKRSVWTVATKPYSGAHFAVFPEELIEPCILAGSAVGDTVLDPFFGSGTTGAVARRNGREFVGIELNEKYIALAEKRLSSVTDYLFANQINA